MAQDLKYGRVMVEHDSPNNPLNNSDEPVFVIRAKDKTALFALQAYADLNKENGDMYYLIGGVHSTFSEWREAHPELLKMPD